MLQLSCLSSLGRLDVDAGVVDCDGSCGLDDGGGGPCLLHSGLCCPTDSLDDIVIIEFIKNKKEEDLLEDLALAAALPPDTEFLLPTAERGCRGVSSEGAAPWLPVQSPVSSSSNSSRTTWHRTSSLAAEPPPPPSPAAVSRLVVPKRKRDRSVMRGRRPWSLAMPSIIPTPHAANPTSSGGDSGVRQESLVLRPPPTNRRRVQRACSHCDSTETPQWRAGPDGPGTLCNACGLRYTLNKLLPEYRPSTSPSFQSDKHSNRHRKVVKLRERNAKDTVVSMPPAPPGDGGGDGFMDVL